MLKRLFLSSTLSHADEEKHNWVGGLSPDIDTGVEMAAPVLTKTRRQVDRDPKGPRPGFSAGVGRRGKRESKKHERCYPGGRYDFCQ